MENKINAIFNLRKNTYLNNMNYVYLNKWTIYAEKSIYSIKTKKYYDYFMQNKWKVCYCLLIYLKVY